MSTRSFIVGITVALLLACTQLCALIASGLAAAIETNVTLALAGAAACGAVLLLAPFVVCVNWLLLLILISSSSLQSLSFWPKNATSAVSLLLIVFVLVVFIVVALLLIDISGAIASCTAPVGAIVSGIVVACAADLSNFIMTVAATTMCAFTFTISVAIKS